ncbi:MAG: response regulator transcription factor [Oscillospiraceae bacterium]|nr:response regulator transcription factor [Oscillospiraceae bacterium]
MDKKIILLVEDDAGIMLSNKKFFKMQGYCVLSAETLLETENILKSSTPDLILLDINLPDGSGLDFITRMRETGLCAAPVIFLTARTDSEDVVDGLKRGGEDYITKPYDFSILAARVEKQIQAAQKSVDVFKCGPLALHIISQQAELDGEDMGLTKKEFALLLLLVGNIGKMLSKEYIYERVWGQPLSGNSGALYAQIKLLKKKLELHESIELCVSRGEGYCLNILD